MKGESKLHRPKYRVMNAVLNQCARINMSKAVFAILLYGIMESVLFGIAMVPSVFPIVTGQSDQGGAAAFPSIAKMSESIVFMLVALFVCIIFNYGLSVIMARMVEKKYVTIGYLFSGFRQKKRIFGASLLFLIIIMIGIGIFTIIVTCRKVDIGSMMTKYSISPKLLFYVIVLLAIVGFLLLPFIFVWLFLYNDTRLSVIKSFGLSIRILFGRMFHFLGFELYAAGIPLIVTIVATVLADLIPENGTMAVRLVSILLSMVSFINQYIASVRMYLAVPIYFYSVTGVMHVHASDEPAEPVDTVAKITDDHNDTDSSDSNGTKNE